MSVKPIFDTLRMLQGGAFLDECADKLAESVRGVDETGKAGKLTITLDLKKTGGALAISAKCTNKAPEAAPDADLMWPTVEGNLQLQNPNQRNLDLQPVPNSGKVVQHIDQSTGEITGVAP